MGGKRRREAWHATVTFVSTPKGKETSCEVDFVA